MRFEKDCSMRLRRAVFGGVSIALHLVFQHQQSEVEGRRINLRPLESLGKTVMRPCAGTSSLVFGTLAPVSIYLGHTRLRDTQRYLTMTTELLEQASICFEQYARPEVPHV